ncbi:Putative threonine efflux protein [Mucinivorans hirudinis]|uniref:Putative threonine efflux protein n=1 Tax=Mucinivorans hirudinis TaxID=1433126 RepID=A0A060RBE9_9BACT|nr:Putative threonine efflux protein [Mucinivorans hirudinis]
MGFLASAPPGPIAIICIQRTLNDNRSSGFISGLGAATADTVFALLAAFALSFVQSFIQQHMFWFQAVGGILVMVLGFSIYMKKVNNQLGSVGTVKSSHLTNYLSTFLLTITNPIYFGVFMVLFAASGIDGAENSLISNLLLILGVGVGTSFWWFILSWGINKFRKKFTVRSLKWLNRISGVVIIVVGAFAIIKMLIDLLPRIVIS